MISVILVDQHEVVRTGMKAIINSVNDIAVPRTERVSPIC